MSVGSDGERTVMDFVTRMPYVHEKGGHDGGGGGDDMKPRIDALERTSLQIVMDLATIKAKVEDMPTKDWVTTRAFWAVAAFSGVVGLIAAVQTLILK